VTVDYATANGTATAGLDYTATAGTLTFAANQATRTFKVPITNDETPEGAETILLALTAPTGGATLGPLATATLTIGASDGGAFRFSAATYSVSEAGRLATITVRREGETTRPATVSYGVTGGTAQLGADFAVSPGSLSFPAGVASRTFTVRIVDNDVHEADRTVGLSLSAPSAGQRLGQPFEATLTITDDDTAGVVQFSSPLVSEVEPGDGETTEVKIAVTRAGGSAADVTVDYATSDGTAEAGTDYVATSGTLTFAKSETRKTFTVALLGDGLRAGNETIHLTLSNPTKGAELGVQSEATLWSVEESGAASLKVVSDPVMLAWLSDDGGGLARALRAHNYRAEVVEAAVDGAGDVVVLPLRLASKAAYRSLLASLAKRPQTLFVLVTPPPRAEAQTTAEAAAGARALATWLVRDALAVYRGHNVAVFDLFNVLTSRDAGDASDAGLTTGNHHRVRGAARQHIQQDAGDVLAYTRDDGDGAPSALGLQKATEELLPLLNHAYNRWKSLPRPLAAAPGVGQRRLRGSDGGSALAPPGRRAN
jgi:hypothetical protein